MKKDAEHLQVIATNRKATHDFVIHQKLEAGIVLVGSEVKSLRAAKVTMADGWVELRKGQAFLHGIQINEYSQANRWQHEVSRVRKLLLHKREIERIIGRMAEKGLTVVPTRIYFKDGRAKVEIALARGKDRFDKRESIKQRESQRDMQRALREANR